MSAALTTGSEADGTTVPALQPGFASVEEYVDALLEVAWRGAGTEWSAVFQRAAASVPRTADPLRAATLSSQAALSCSDRIGTGTAYAAAREVESAARALATPRL